MDAVSFFLLPPPAPVPLMPKPKPILPPLLKSILGSMKMRYLNVADLAGRLPLGAESKEKPPAALVKRDGQGGQQVAS